MMEQRTEMLKQMKKQNVLEVGYLDAPVHYKLNELNIQYGYSMDTNDF